ncbi:hypothetical protein B0H66DRAFT_70196 [Apodospora peruviana]|uniref:Uncharacterized protein n=1 Tax=Apodospora peruviana TaxID=516989 RepID=A0AAE0MFJ1_9PEZI|nr:hypothetical protein B0H66DRAFT_70196 [Apodospora peruviana]
MKICIIPVQRVCLYKVESNRPKCSATLHLNTNASSEWTRPGLPRSTVRSSSQLPFEQSTVNSHMISGEMAWWGRLQAGDLLFLNNAAIHPVSMRGELGTIYLFSFRRTTQRRCSFTLDYPRRCTDLRPSNLEYIKQPRPLLHPHLLLHSNPHHYNNQDGNTQYTVTTITVLASNQSHFLRYRCHHLFCLNDIFQPLHHLSSLTIIAHL